MLLDHDLLAVAEVWRHRETIEYEAAAHFDRLATGLGATAAPPVVVQMAARAGDDEREHAALCRQLVDEFAPGLARRPSRTKLTIGPTDLPPVRAVLYASVAVSCVTETLSAALLVEMHARAKHQGVKRTVQQILTDEVRHSRLGWAHLAFAAEHDDVGWLSPYIAGMLREAVGEEVTPMTRSLGAPDYGVLARDTVRGLVTQTIDQVIRPGLARFGVACDTDLQS